MPPEVNLRNEKNNGEFILKLINLGLVNSVHDVSTGGIILALAEMSISSQIGVKIHKPEVGNRRGTVFVTAGKPNIVRGTFGEDLGAYALGALIGMAIEYAITGKIYYYKGAI